MTGEERDPIIAQLCAAIDDLRWRLAVVESLLPEATLNKLDDELTAFFLKHFGRQRADDDLPLIKER